MISIGPQAQFLEDPDNRYTVGTVTRLPDSQWQRSTAAELNFGYTDSVYWIRFTLQGREDGDVLVEIRYPVLDWVEAYVFREGERVADFQMGDQKAFAERPVDHPNFVFPLDLAANTATTVYLRVDTSSSMQIPIRIWDEKAFIADQYNEVLLLSLFYGAILIMALYNLLIFISVREISFFYYVMYCLSMVTLAAGIDGVTFKFLWPEATWWNDASILVALSGAVIFPSLFTRTFLDLPKARPVVSKLVLAIAAMAALTAIGAFLLPYRIMVMATLMLTLFSIAVSFVTGLLRWKDGYYSARYYVLAWSFMLIGGAIMTLNKLGILPRNLFTENASILGTSLELMLLSFALANRMTIERRMREAAQRETAAAQQSLIEHQRQVNEQLDQKVRERTEELEAANVKLQEMSVRDSLTGLHNRRHFDEALTVEYKRAYRDRTALAVVMLDIDHFKAINDNYGHPFGDECLIRASAIIQQHVKRPPDVVARYGGEEFVILLPNTDMQGAITVAQDIQASFRSNVVPFASQNEGRMTVSIGLACLIPGQHDAHEALLKQADEMLYKAKHNGRNRIESRQPSAHV
ncbi:sensor domain-containing diguanylate cyclase [Marinobacter fonticola]|uniref:sensor domain-containing diguanylate cyclase n=1 Tax=Marinobacter fonticola TaxID=2603215 RepID=UPI00143E0B6E|nr:diguanylate cyclase [Marinobacter fonticola]